VTPEGGFTLLTQRNAEVSRVVALSAPARRGCCENVVVGLSTDGQSS
jgi:predicted phage gp36 major capsid-like protein